MKLAIDARESGTTTGRYIDKLLEYLHGLEPDFEVLVLTKSHRLDYFRQVTPNFKVVKSDFKEFGLGEQIGFARQLYSLGADLVHFSMTQQPLLYWRRSVTTVHDLTTVRFYNPAKNYLVFKSKQLVYRGVIWWAAHKSRAVLTPSLFVKNDLARFAHVRPDKIIVTHEAAQPIEGPSAAVAKLKGKKFILYVGQAHPHKNLERLAQAFDLLRASHPELHLVIAGRKNRLHERLEASLNTPGVVFTGFVSEAKLKWLYQNCQAYVFPSLSEGFGLPGLEAMVHGAPVVAADATCLPEVYGRAARYFNPLEPTDIADKIKDVIDSPKIRADLIASGHEQAAKYSWAKTAQQTLDVYRRFI